jgi:hypothetical protein
MAMAMAVRIVVVLTMSEIIRLSRSRSRIRAAAAPPVNILASNGAQGQGLEPQAARQQFRFKAVRHD